MSLYDVLQLIKSNMNYIMLFFALFEFIVRTIPTKKNYSLIDFIKNFMSGIHQILDNFLPNKRLKK